MSGKPLFRDLTGDDPDPECTTIESLCMNCQEMGETRLLLTKIPYYKEIVLMSFCCQNCGYQNNEIQSSSILPENGVKITLKVKDSKDLNRQLVKSDHTEVKIPEVNLEIIAESQKGEVTTVEGILDRAIAGLEQDQSRRYAEHPDSANQIAEYIKSLHKLKLEPFTLELTDISGNCFIENLVAPKTDPNCVYEYFKRTKEQDHELGVFSQEELKKDENLDKPVVVEEEAAILHPIKEDEFPLEEIDEGEIMSFPTNCPNCDSPCKTNMKMTNIPHFKQVIIMATSCELCGNKTNEVKSGAGIEPKGVHIEVRVRNKDDLTRDVLKSETCDLQIPELELTVGPHAIGGRFTTIEGLIMAIKDQLNDPTTSHMFGDSKTEESRQQFENFLNKLDEILNNNLEATIVLDDPCGNSYIQSMADGDTDGELDEQLTIRHYERTFEQNEDLGLNDMKTENYC